MAVRFIIEKAFLDLGLEQLEIHTALDNIPSNKIASNVGFKLERVELSSEILYGKSIDNNVYALKKSDILLNPSDSFDIEEKDYVSKINSQ